MANTLTEVIPKLLAQGLLALRQQAIMPRLVNRAYDAQAGEKGSTIDVPIPSAVTVASVTAAATPPSTNSQTPTSANIVMSNWEEAAFFLTDQDMQEAMNGFIPMQASEAVKAIANSVDVALLSLYKNIYGSAGVAGTAPFAADLSEYLAARKEMADQLAPMDPRYMVIDPTAEANALALRQFSDAAFRGDDAGIINGQIGRKYGALWVMDQNIPAHAAMDADLLGAINDAGAIIAGVKTLTVDALTSAPNEGDIFTIADITGQYVCDAGCTTTLLNFTPGLENGLATADGSEVITFHGAHTPNLLFHRDAFALAMRPFSGVDPLNLGAFQSALDPVSGLALRLEVTREHKRTRFSYDVLYGVQTVRPELAVRVLG